MNDMVSMRKIRVGSEDGRELALLEPGAGVLVLGGKEVV
jgi:hypothetical protein